MYYYSIFHDKILVGYLPAATLESFCIDLLVQALKRDTMKKKVHF